MKQSYHTSIYPRARLSTSVTGLGRKGTLIAFWIVGYAVGAFAWMVRTPVLQFIESVGVSSDTSQALVAGLFGSTIMVLAVLTFSFLSSGNSS